MTQAEIFETVSVETGLTKTDVKRIFEVYKQLGFKHMKKNKLDSDFLLPGFGKFKVTQRAARKGINPKTMEPVKIPARKVPVFRCGSELRYHIQPKRK